MKKIAYNQIGPSKCTGCFACFNVCNSKAIEMKLNNEGFFTPLVNDEKCNECGACSRKCPVIKTSECSNFFVKAYAGWNNDEEVRKQSSSGGIFSAVAKHVINNLNGAVYGATYENGIVKHIRVDNIENLKKLRKSKYLQSYMGDSYKQVMNDLNTNKWVLFVGTPCQVAALNSLVKNKDKLITCDLVCHGVPSYLAFESYIESVNMNSKEIEIDFRNKDKGWKNFEVILEDKKNKKKIKNHHLENKFFKGFVDNLYLKRSCYDCKFSSMPRVGDITFGDFWGVSQEYYNDLGVSIIVANNQKGNEIINTLNDIGEITIKEVEKDNLGENKRIFNGKYEVPKVRENMVEYLTNYNFNMFYNKYIHTSLYKRIKRKLRNLLSGK